MRGSGLVSGSGKSKTFQLDFSKPMIEDDEPLNLFIEERGCFTIGDARNQIFWYTSMGNPDFGIHMDAEEFEEVFGELPPEEREGFFRSGLCHEYFHHIVDSWCVRADIDRSPLMEHYEREIRKSKPIFILEESMAEAFSANYTKIPRARSGPYSLYATFSHNDDENWKKGSIIVAHQYMEGKYKLDGLVPGEGFTRENFALVEIDTKWGDSVPKNSNFDDEVGFSKDLVSGVWTLEDIPFHIHNQPNHRDWVQSRRQFYSEV